MFKVRSLQILYISLIILCFLLTGCASNKSKVIATEDQPSDINEENVTSTPELSQPSMDDIQTEPGDTPKDEKDYTEISNVQTEDIQEVIYKENLCTDDEEVLFSFKLADSPKTISVCISNTQPDYITCRIGTPNNIDLEFPENKEGSWSEFTYSYYFRGGGAGNEGMDLNYLSFEYDGYKYVIYEEYIAENNTKTVGVKTIDNITNMEVNNKGLSDSIEGSLIDLRFSDKINIELQ
jgi:hypothetical protein